MFAVTITLHRAVSKVCFMMPVQSTIS